MPTPKTTRGPSTARDAMKTRATGIRAVRKLANASRIIDQRKSLSSWHAAPALATWRCTAEELFVGRGLLQTAASPREPRSNCGVTQPAAKNLHPSQRTNPGPRHRTIPHFAQWTDQGRMLIKRNDRDSDRSSRIVALRRRATHILPQIRSSPLTDCADVCSLRVQVTVVGILPEKKATVRVPNSTPLTALAFAIMVTASALLNHCRRQGNVPTQQKIHSNDDDKEKSDTHLNHQKLLWGIEKIAIWKVKEHYIETSPITESHFRKRLWFR